MDDRIARIYLAEPMADADAPSIARLDAMMKKGRANVDKRYLLHPHRNHRRHFEKVTRTRQIILCSGSIRNPPRISYLNDTDFPRYRRKAKQISWAEQWQRALT